MKQVVLHHTSQAGKLTISGKIAVLFLSLAQLTNERGRENYCRSIPDMHALPYAGYCRYNRVTSASDLAPQASQKVESVRTYAPERSLSQASIQNQSRARFSAVMRDFHG